MMKRPNLVLGVVCAVVGCAAGMTGRSMAMAAEAPLPEPKVVHRWQGQCLAVSFQRANEEIRRLGEAGWELVSGDTGGTFCFKRPAE